MKPLLQKNSLHFYFRIVRHFRQLQKEKESPITEYFSTYLGNLQSLNLNLKSNMKYLTHWSYRNIGHLIFMEERGCYGLTS